MSGPTVAVVTPVYNGAAYIAETMASVQAQTYPNIVHFILDNASNDDTYEVIRSFRSTNVPVIVRRNSKHLTLAENWNLCVELGGRDNDYFRLLCADDTLMPTSIEKTVALAETDPLIAVVGCDQQTSLGEDIFNWDPACSVFDGRQAVKACLLGDAGMQASHLLCRSCILDLRDKFYDGNFSSIVDAEAIFFALSQKNHKFGFVHEPLAFSRRHASSVTATSVASVHGEFFDWYKLMRQLGCAILSKSEYREYEKKYRRYYFRRLLVWRFFDKNIKAYDWHKRALGSFSDQPNAVIYMDAIINYLLEAIGFRRRWDQYPF